MIAIYQRTAAGVVRAATTATTSEARAYLRGLRVPALACDGLEPVGATGYTTASDLRAILAEVNGGRVTPDGRGGAGRACAAPGCTLTAARGEARSVEHLLRFCSACRKSIRACRGLDHRDAAAVDAYLVRRAARRAQP